MIDSIYASWWQDAFSCLGKCTDASGTRLQPRLFSETLTLLQRNHPIHLSAIQLTDLIAFSIPGPWYLKAVVGSVLLCQQFASSSAFCHMDLNSFFGGSTQGRWTEQRVFASMHLWLVFGSATPKLYSLDRGR